MALILSGTMGHIHAIDQARSIVRQLLAALPVGSYLSLNDVDAYGVVGRKV